MWFNKPYISEDGQEKLSSYDCNQSNNMIEYINIIIRYMVILAICLDNNKLNCVILINFNMYPDFMMVLTVAVDHWSGSTLERW